MALNFILYRDWQDSKNISYDDLQTEKPSDLFLSLDYFLNPTKCQVA